MEERPRPPNGSPDPVAEAYDRWCATYDADVNATRDLDAQVLRAHDLALEGCEVLELGCGTGKNTVWLAQKAREVLALDFSAGMLDKARERLRDSANVRFAQQDLREMWPVADASRDRVVGNLVLEHVRDVRLIFREAWRVLRDGGTYYLSELHPYRQLQGRQARFQVPGEAEPVLVDAFVHDVQDYVGAALAAGFTLQSLAEVRDPGVPPSVLPRLLVVIWRKTSPA